VTKTLVEVSGLKKYFPVRKGMFSRDRRVVKAVDGVSFTIREGETLALVGESGCGKSTTGRMILRLIEPTAGKVTFDGRDLLALPARQVRELRKDMQIVFQDPFGSLNPRLKVKDIIGEPLRAQRIGSRKERLNEVKRLLEVVGLSPGHADRYPHEFSGGQRQRISIARALALSPKLVVCDEAVSALDVSVQAQILNLLEDLQRDFGLTYLFISHNLSVVHHLSDRVGVMYLGKLVELGPVDRIFAQPAHPYTQALLSAIPEPKVGGQRERIVLQGDVPSPVNPPSGCRFHTRCPYARPDCRAQDPEFRELADGRHVACHYPLTE
jgi:oligopeptide/dipeptide ABC transporter ATP-binding protein